MINIEEIKKVLRNYLQKDLLFNFNYKTNILTD